MMGGSSMAAVNFNLRCDRIEMEGGSTLTVSESPPTTTNTDITTPSDSSDDGEFNAAGSCLERRHHADSYGSYTNASNGGTPTAGRTIGSGAMLIEAGDYLHLDGTLSSEG